MNVMSRKLTLLSAAVIAVATTHSPVFPQALSGSADVTVGGGGADADVDANLSLGGTTGTASGNVSVGGGGADADVDASIGTGGTTGTASGDVSIGGGSADADVDASLGTASSTAAAGSAAGSTSGSTASAATSNSSRANFNAIATLSTMSPEVLRATVQSLSASDAATLKTTCKEVLTDPSAPADTMAVCKVIASL